MNHVSCTAVLTIGVVTWPYAHKSFLWASDIFFTYKFTILAFIMFNFHNLRHVYFLSRTLNLPSARQASAFTFYLPGAGKSTNHKRCDAWQVKNWEFVAKSRTRVYFAQHVAATCNIAIEIFFGDKLRAKVVIRATTLFNLQCNNVRQVERKCCPYYLAFVTKHDFIFCS